MSLDSNERFGVRAQRVDLRAMWRSALGLGALIVTALIARWLDEPSGTAVAQVTVLCTGAAACAATVAGVGRSRASARRPTRIAVIGSQATAVSLAQTLTSTMVTAYTSLGWIASHTEHDHQSADPVFPSPAALGGIDELAQLVERHQIDLLLIGSNVPRLDVFDELVRLTDIIGVRVCELSAFYEDVFGHIPVAEINSTWFQYVMHPKFNPTTNYAKRVFDLTVATCLAVVAVPLLLFAAVLIKLEGGKLLYTQRRIGEKGRPFMMYKLRTMRERGPDDDSQIWCSVDDPRVTRVGRVLRRLHIDELPQLYNILRGEMSVVGPRPEQPSIVARLESGIEFYSRRHLVKPGLAGWAQLRCGYARSDRGSAWKLCHDLYYLKHQSLRFDCVILMRTLLTLALPERHVVSRAIEPLPAFSRDEPVSVVSR